MRARSSILAVGLALCAAACTCGGAANQPPTVVIASPLDGQVLRGAGPFGLFGQATDPEEVLPDAKVVWSSDRDGVLGNGPSIQARLSGGLHRIALDATDSKGATARAQVTVTVVPDVTGDNPPTATIEQPTADAYFDQGVAIPLKGHATDPEDGTLTGGALTWTTSLGGVIGTGEQLSFTNAALGNHRLVLTATDRTGRTGYASVDIHVVPPGTNRPPTVTIVTPANGASLILGVAATLRGMASDPEDGAITGPSLQWTSSRDGALGTGPTLDVMLTQGVHTLSLKATDSMGLATTAQVTVSVNAPNNLPPTASITAPATGVTVFQGTAVVFAGSGTDPEDGALTGAALSWTSSRDGALGTASPLSISTLTAGDHTITLIARDSGGNTGTASVIVHVLPQNSPPLVAITAPADGSSFSAGTTVAFTATATDPEDGPLSGTSLTWRSSRDGVMGTGSPLSTSSLSIGSHQITLTATDSGGRSASASIQLTVTMAPVNMPPVALLTGPSTGQATQVLTFDGSTSSDSDGTIVTYRFDFGDGTAPVSGAATTSPHTFATPGTFTVTLTVTDNQGATGTASSMVAITPWVRVPVVVDASPEDHGAVCNLVAQGSTLHLAWYSGRHPTIWYATYLGGTLTREPVDGAGFNVGGGASSVLSLALDGAGAPHLAYVLSGQVWYATKASGSWVRERVDTPTVPYSSSSNSAVTLALDASAGFRPTVVYPYLSSSYLRVAIATRTAPGTWTVLQPIFQPGGVTSFYDQRVLGDAVFDSAGTLYLPLLFDGYPYATNGTYLVTAAGSTLAMRSLSTGGLPGITSNASLAWSAPSRLFLMSGSGLLDIQVATPLSASTARNSLVEVAGTGQHAVAADATGQPRVVANLGATLEAAHANSSGFWVWEGLGTTDSAQIDAAVDAAGDTRACFFRAGKLVVY